MDFYFIYLSFILNISARSKEFLRIKNTIQQDTLYKRLFITYPGSVLVQIKRTASTIDKRGCD